jgi:hypothetical protein
MFSTRWDVTMGVLLRVSENIQFKYRQIKMSEPPMLWMTYGMRWSQWAGNRPGRMDSDQAGSGEEKLPRVQSMSDTRRSHNFRYSHVRNHRVFHLEYTKFPST